MISNNVHALVAVQAKMGQVSRETMNKAADGADELAASTKERAIEKQQEAAETRAESALANALINVGVTIAGAAIGIATGGGGLVATAAVQVAGGLAGGIGSYLLAQEAAGDDAAAARLEAKAAKYGQQRDDAQKLSDENRRHCQQQIDTALDQSKRMLDNAKYV